MTIQMLNPPTQTISAISNRATWDMMDSCFPSTSFIMEFGRARQTAGQSLAMQASIKPRPVVAHRLV
jgi:hypothetical protein